jgi:ATP-dependent Clp protease ATP-binding subunit ClpC
MFERYDEPARRVLFFARFEASNLGSLTIETEHLLLGLIREMNGLAGPVLGALPLLEIRTAIENRAGSSGTVPPSVEIPFSAETKRVLHFAAEEADRLEHRHIGSEHLLLGLLREEGSFAASLLASHGLRLGAARDRVRDLVAHPPPSGASEAAAREQVLHIMDLVQRLGLTLSDNPEAAMRLALILEDLRRLKGMLEGKP